jgi:CysZ protein
MNGYLLGREYFELVALRHSDFDAARALRRRNRGMVFASGIVVAVLFTVPLLGWFMPAFATAFMVHVYENMRRKMTPRPP